jgi:hypothetical protein
MKLFLIFFTAFVIISSAVVAGPSGPAAHSAAWHNHGAGHQKNNDPGDTAADRHNFAVAPTPSGKYAGPKK